ncbi:MAG TPA: M28 family metallopeptidase [Terriglobales bacterium]|nr:M28 family metallopeptidase [Terriglobales bacterium]
MKGYCLAILLATTFYVALSAQELSPTDQAAADAAIRVIRPEAIAAHMRFLSDALLEGRGTGERGHEIAARYVASELEAIGLAPAGVNGTWFQPLQLRKAELIPEQTSFELVRDGKSTMLVRDRDYIIYANLLQTDATVNAGAVFVGYGVTAPEFQYDDYSGADVKGKVAVVLRGAPARFPSTERAYFASALTMQQNAAAHGAIGVIVIDSPEFLQGQWNRVMLQLRADPPMRWLDPQGAPSDTVPEIRALIRTNQSGAEALFAGAPKSLPEVFAAAKAGQPGSFPLPGTVRIHLANRFTRVESRNVIAKLTGSDPTLANEYVVYSAHLDHLGICRPGEPDPICHGAADNASGTGAVLEIARAFASLPRAPRRSTLFLFVTGEERGFLGSDYFVHYPTVPLENIVADVNIDGAPGLRFPIKDIVPQGAEHSTLSRDVLPAAREMGYTISPDPRPEEGFFTRSDQYSFVRRGVPSVKVDGGTQSTDPTIDGATLAKNWTATNYHTPNDNMNQRFYFDAAAKSTALNFLIGYEVAQQSERPAWNAGDFFGTKFAHKQ